LNEKKVDETGGNERMNVQRTTCHTKVTSNKHFCVLLACVCDFISGFLSFPSARLFWFFSLFKDFFLGRNKSDEEDRRNLIKNAISYSLLSLEAQKQRRRRRFFLP
jgi:hypothetical protein